MEDRQRLADDFIEIAAHGLRRGEARELGELVHQRFHRFHGLGDGGGAFVDDAGGAGRQVQAVELAADALGGKRDRRQRVLDLMGHAARHFMPCRRLLRAQELAGIFEDHDETRGELRFQRRNRHRQVDLAAVGVQFQLPGRQAGAPRALHEVLDFGGVLAREEVFQAGGFGARERWKNPRQRLIHVLDGAIGADRDHARRNALQDGFGEAPAAVEFDAARFQRLGHLVESSDQERQFVLGANGHAMLQVAAADLVGGFQDGGDRRGDTVGQDARQPGGDEQHEERDQHHQHDVQRAVVLAVAGDLRPIVAVSLDFQQLLTGVQGNPRPEFDGAVPQGHVDHGRMPVQRPRRVRSPGCQGLARRRQDGGRFQPLLRGESPQGVRCDRATG